MYFSFRKSKNLEVFKSLKFRLSHKFSFIDEVVLLDFPSLVGGLPCVCVVLFCLTPLLFFLAGSFGLRSGFYSIRECLESYSCTTGRVYNCAIYFSPCGPVKCKLRLRQLSPGSLLISLFLF